jgi:hypothetical protein
VGALGLVGYLIAFLGTLMVAGDRWHETSIGQMLRQRVLRFWKGQGPP